MKQIPSIDQQFKTQVALDPGAVLYGYREARRKGLDLMILNDFNLFAGTVPTTVASLRKHGIKQVALTATSTALMSVLWAFTEAGATFEMKQIDTGDDDSYSPQFVPGFIITVN